MSGVDWMWYDEQWALHEYFSFTIMCVFNKKKSKSSDRVKASTVVWHVARWQPHRSENKTKISTQKKPQQTIQTHR